MKAIITFIFLLFSVVNSYSQGWGEIQKIVPDDRFAGQQFGADVAIDGDYAVVGLAAHAFAKNAYVYMNDGNGNWQQIQTLESPDFNQFDLFGTAVDISGDYIIVGAWGENNDAGNSNFLASAGAAYIFKKQTSGLFEFQQKIVASDREALNHFGFKLAISGNYAVVGVARQDFDASGESFLEYAGATYVFEKDDSETWTQVQKIVPSDRAAHDNFGVFGVSINGNYLLVGAPYEDEDEIGENTLSRAGSVYIFERDGSGTWNEIQKIVASDRDSGSFFGWSVDLKGDNLVVGASEDNALTGSAYIFIKNSNDLWEESQKFVISDASSGDRFGQCVSIDGNHIIVGAYLKTLTQDNTTYPGVGRAYVFEKDGTGTWNQIRNIVASDIASSNYFGFSVAISGDYAMVGAYQEDQDESGMNFLSNAGSVYIFEANEPSLSISQFDLKNNIGVYPNPVKDIVNIDLGKHYNKVAITITNLLGQHVFFQNYQNIKSIALPFNMPKGMYVVEVRTENTRVSVLKIMKR